VKIYIIRHGQTEWNGKMAKIIMVQGTASGVGKSVLAAALCRIFTQDGFKVAPFKPQNMTSIYHTLGDGRRMARSQAVAAYACNAEPVPDMNPVLLIMGENGTEIVINGVLEGMMNRHEYTEYKRRAFGQIIAAYQRLSASYDIIIAEGAGSPVELNLNKNDIVNMGFARAANAPVLLVSDISRGGVFASLFGTVALMPDDERRLVKGLVVNKFKGDAQLFADGVKILEDLCGAPVLGVIPHTEIMLEDEDGLADGEVKTRESLMKKIGAANYGAHMQAEFDRLAAHFRKHLDMAQIYAILNGGA